MPVGSKIFAVTVPLAAFVGSAAGVVLAPWASEQIKARTGVSLMPAPVTAYVATPAPGSGLAMPPPPSRVLPGPVFPSASATNTLAPAGEMPPVPGAGRSPFDADPTAPPRPGAAPTPDGAAADEDDRMAQAPEAELPLPADYFDISKLASKEGDAADPPVLKPGQYLQVEVLEALPGRPITGNRVIRPDGTISLGFYGDLPVAGMNRHQIKVRLLERLTRFLSHQVLGFERWDDQGRRVVPAVDTDRIFIDESVNFEPAYTIPAPTRSFPFEPTGSLREQINNPGRKTEHPPTHETKPN